MGTQWQKKHCINECIVSFLRIETEGFLHLAILFKVVFLVIDLITEETEIQPLSSKVVGRIHVFRGLKQILSVTKMHHHR